MFCAKCGTQVEQGSKFCQKCGTAVNPPPAEQYNGSFQPAAAPAPQPTAPPSSDFQPVAVIKTSGMAVASLVLGIIGLVFNPALVPSILAIIFGAVGLGQIGKSNGMLKGKGQAAAGLVLGIIAIVITIIVIVLFGFSLSWISDVANDFSGFTY
jgi:hypothetical protein